jgi:glycerophosphoryl diester phosphodiesterase
VRVPELVAHRGYALRFPENTLSALRAALDAGARRLEVDVQLSSDGVPFLFHDRNMQRVCGVPGALHERSAAQLAELRASEPGRFGERFAGEPLARLSDLLALLAERPEAFAFVELKRASIEVFGPRAVLDAVLGGFEAFRGRCALISFDVGVLRLARTQCDLPLGPVLKSWRQAASPEVLDLAPEYVFCDVEKLPPGPLSFAGARLAVYEVAEPGLALELARRGVDLIETFAIAEMLRALAGPGSAP